MSGKCLHCSGTGKRACESHTDFKPNCSYCKGGKQTVCTKCSGSGKKAPIKSMTPESMKGVTQNIASLGLEDTDAMPSANGVKVELLSFQDFPGKPTVTLEIGEFDSSDEYIKMPRRQLWIGGDSASFDITKGVEKGKRIFEITNPYKVLGIAVMHKMDHLGFCTTELNGIDGSRTLSVKKRNKSNFMDANESMKFDQYVSGKGTITLQLTFGKSINKGATTTTQAAATTPTKSATTAPVKSAATTTAPSTTSTSSTSKAPTSTATTEVKKPPSNKKPRKVTVEVISYQGFQNEPCLYLHYGAFWPKYEKPGVRGGGVYDGQKEECNERKYSPGELKFEIPAGDWEDKPFFGFVICYKAMYAIAYVMSPIDGEDGERVLPLKLRQKDNWTDQEANWFDKYGAENATLTVKVTHAF